MFTWGGERDRTWLRTRSHEEANEVARGRERVCTRRRTKSHAVANAFARGGERDRTRSRTRSRYTLYPGSTVHVAYKLIIGEMIVRSVGTSVSAGLELELERPDSEVDKLI